MRRLILLASVILWLLIGISLYARQTEELVVSLQVKKMDTFDFSGTQFFELRRGHLVVVISSDPTNDLAKFLNRHDKQRIVLVLTGKEHQ